jgi:hypothetical protein
MDPVSNPDRKASSMSDSMSAMVTLEACEFILTVFREDYPTMAYAVENGALNGLDLCDEILVKIDEAFDEAHGWWDEAAGEGYCARDAWREGALWYRVYYTYA